MWAGERGLIPVSGVSVPRPRFIGCGPTWARERATDAGRPEGTRRARSANLGTASVDEHDPQVPVRRHRRPGWFRRSRLCQTGDRSARGLALPTCRKARLIGVQKPRRIGVLRVADTQRLAHECLIFGRHSLKSMASVKNRVGRARTRPGSQPCPLTPVVLPGSDKEKLGEGTATVTAGL